MTSGAKIFNQIFELISDSKFVEKINWLTL